MDTEMFAIILSYLEIICTLAAAQSCQNCAGDGSCNEQSQCNYGCIPGFYSLTCTQTCGQCAGNGSCNINSRFCDERKCSAAFFGPLCTQPCPIFCGGNGSCDFTTANCLEGCKLGHMGARCEISCPYTNCKNPCNVLNGGSCTSGCLSGFYGDVCDKRCKCSDGRGCDQKTGICFASTLLTTPSWMDYGWSCTESTSSTQSIKSSSTTKESGIFKINTGLLVGLMLSLSLVLILTSLSVFLLYKHHKRKQKKPHVYEGPVIQQAKEIVYDSLEAIAENDYVEIRSDSFVREKEDGYTVV